MRTVERRIIVKEVSVEGMMTEKETKATRILAIMLSLILMVTIMVWIHG